MKYGLTEKALSLILSELSKYDQIESAVIFGSRAMGNYKLGSDIDLVIYGKGVNHEILNRLSFRLNEELPLPYYFDVLVYHLVESEALKEHINEFGKVIYRR